MVNEDIVFSIVTVNDIIAVTKMEVTTTNSDSYKIL